MFYFKFRFMKREHLIDVTEVFRNLNSQKKFRLIKLGIYLIFFSILMFRYVQHLVHNYSAFLFGYFISFTYPSFGVRASCASV